MNHLLAEYAMCDHFTWWGQDSAKGQWTVALGNLLVSVSLGSDHSTVATTVDSCLFQSPLHILH